MKDNEINTYLEENICTHIFSVSAAMIGVCLTVIGLIRVIIKFHKADTIADDLLAIDSLLFLVSCLLSYWALRAHKFKRMHYIERIADSIFIIAMLLMTCICGFIAFEIVKI